MYAFWVYTIVVCEHYLKVKLFHLLVRVVESISFGVDVLDCLGRQGQAFPGCILLYQHRMFLLISIV